LNFQILVFAANKNHNKKRKSGMKSTEERKRIKIEKQSIKEEKNVIKKNNNNNFYLITTFCLSDCKMHFRVLLLLPVAF